MLLIFMLVAAGCSPQQGTSEAEETVTLLPAEATLTPQATSTGMDDDQFEALMAQLMNDNPQVRLSAAEALGISGEARAVEPLMTALEDVAAEVRRAAAIALGDIADPRSAEALVGLLKDPDDGVRMGAGYALRMLEEGAVVPLCAALGDVDAEVRLRATEILFDVGDERAIEPLITLLMDDDPDVRSAAARTLGHIGDARAVDPLVTAMILDPGLPGYPDGSTGVQQAIAEALAEIGAPAVESLIICLDDGDINVRRWSAYGLGIIGDARAVERLIQSLHDEDPIVRANAAEALGLIRDARAVEPLIALLGDEYPLIRQEVIGALAEINNERAIEGLKGAFRDEDWNVRDDACDALEVLGVSTVEPLIAVLGDGDGLIRKWAAGLLAETKDERAVEPMLAALGAGDLEVVAGAYRFFIGVGEPGTEEVLIRALNQYGTEEMAEAFLNCGNAVLKEAATTWAKEHGYIIVDSGSGNFPRWGSGAW